MTNFKITSGQFGTKNVTVNNEKIANIDFVADHVEVTMTKFDDFFSADDVAEAIYFIAYEMGINEYKIS